MTMVYVSPTGSGNKSGSDWANAGTLANLDTMIKKAGAGGQVLLAADKGAYAVGSAINLYAAGADGAPVTIKGVSSATGAAMDVTINGTRPANWSNGSDVGNELFKFQKGAGHLVFENMDINNVGVAFRAAGDVADITIQHVDATNVGRFFEDYAGGSNKTATVSGLVVRDVDVTGFSSGVIRLMYDSHDIVIEDVHGDAAGQNAGYPVGVQLSGTTHDVAIRRTIMENMVDSTSGTYWQGDGFGTEGGVRGVLFEDTVARGNGDGGYDLKSSDNTLIRAVAEDNKRNFRIWTDAKMEDVVGLDPHLRGGIGAQDQLWVAANAKVTVAGGTFSDSGSKTIVFENEGGSVQMVDTVVTMANDARFLVGKALTGLVKADAITTAVTGVFSIATAVALPTRAEPAVAPAATVPQATPAVGATVLPTPVIASPAPTAAPAHTAVWNRVIASASSETLTATAGKDKFVFDLAKKTGTDVIVGFGHDDLLVTSTALKDGNGDGIITFGANKVLDLGGSKGTVKLTGVQDGLRLVGQTDEGFLYAAADVRPHGAKEGRLGVADTLKGDTGDKLAQTFFFDTALGIDSVKDKITVFGAKDILVTTTKIADVPIGSSIAAGTGGFDLGSGSAGVAISDLGGKAVGALEFDGDVTAGGVHYYVYSLEHSTAGMASLTF